MSGKSFLNHADIAITAFAARDEATRKLKALTDGAISRSLTPGERKREKELIGDIAEHDASAKRHMIAAATEASAMRAHSPLDTLGTTRGSGAAEDRKATPGELMARSLETARGITTTGTGKAFSPEQTAAQFVDLLAPQSVVMESGVSRVNTASETYSFPVVRSDFSAGFIGELDDLPTGGFGADPLKVTPKKVAAADLIANELVQDGGSGFLNPMAKSLMRSVALGFDREALVGTGAGKGFVGISKTPGIQAHAVTGGLKDLDPFIAAFGKLEAAHAEATAVVMHPKTWAGLMALRETTGSLKPLLSESAGAPTSNIKRAILGVNVWLSSFLPENEILTYEAEQIFAVFRKDAGFQTSDQYGFLKDGMAVRAIARAAIAVPNVSAVCKITVTA
ncbi:phage major capsid protein [Streptomyces sp. BPTC-684]|uniref:phage major capsid protein n=1 Tax=Streptomyces sp. BPTC-684 TaxID=3043734 RepID=UPI0024B05779|nr:phage major capsid protein [Streptomyces sp. BPTC-684]WHM38850.1 phage major capsid protein [Streptomyces sp. BPTC-684]